MFLESTKRYDLNCLPIPVDEEHAQFIKNCPMHFNYTIWSKTELTPDELIKLRKLLTSFPNSQDDTWQNRFKFINFDNYSKKILKLAANAVDSQNYKVLGIAARTGSNGEAVQTLINIGADVNGKDETESFGQVALHWAISNVYACDKDRLEPLEPDENLKTLKCLLENHANVFYNCYMDEYGENLNLLEYAKKYGYPKAATIIEEHINASRPQPK